MFTKKLTVAVAAALFALPLMSANAGVVTLTTGQSEFREGTLNQGWWSSSYSNSDNNDNHYTGVSSGPELRSFYTFDLSNVQGKVTSATLKVMRGDQYRTVNLGLWDVLSPASDVNYNNGQNSAIFADLGSGKSYGNYEISTGRFNDYLELAVNAQGLNDMRKTAGFFTIGAAVDAAAGEVIFSSTGRDVTYLILEVADKNEVPEPASLALLLAGVSGLVAARRRK